MSISLVVALMCTMLAPLGIAGLALIHQGLGRSRSAAHTMLATLCVLAIATMCFVAVGSSLTGFSGGAMHSFVAGGVPWNWLGAEPLLMQAERASQLRPVILCLEMFAAALAATIPVSAGSDRWRLAPICLSAAVFAGLIFPLLAHWVWAGGWLAQLGTTFGIARAVDAGGAGVIQVAGGLMALSVSWILGPRRGKYDADGTAAAIPGHNIVQVLFGCLLSLVGWIGLDSASSILFYGAGPEQIAIVIIHATLSAAAGCLAAVLTTRIRYRKPDASLSANGWIAGLVAGSASCAFVSPGAALVTGAVAGVLATLLIEVFELHLLVDDPSGSVSVHAGAGLWGLIAAGLFVHPSSASAGRQLLAQLIYAATCVGLILPLIHAVNLLLNRLVHYRVDADGDWQGMDVRELGAGAYPEFVVHADEFLPR